MKTYDDGVLEAWTQKEPTIQFASISGFETQSSRCKSLQRLTHIKWSCWTTSCMHLLSPFAKNFSSKKERMVLLCSNGTQTLLVDSSTFERENVWVSEWVRVCVIWCATYDSCYLLGRKKEKGQRDMSGETAVGEERREMVRESLVRRINNTISYMNVSSELYGWRSELYSLLCCRVDTCLSFGCVFESLSWRLGAPLAVRWLHLQRCSRISLRAHPKCSTSLFLLFSLCLHCSVKRPSDSNWREKSGLTPLLENLFWMDSCLIVVVSLIVITGRIFHVWFAWWHWLYFNLLRKALHYTSSNREEMECTA